MKKFIMLFFLTIGASFLEVNGQSCSVIPEAGKTYVAGYCITEINSCSELAPDSGMSGDCFIAKDGNTPPSIG
ncbi:MAG: hypothetical protein ACI9UV_001569 [Algoriphagus sp.]|jgi:hypothetical protein